MRAMITGAVLLPYRRTTHARPATHCVLNGSKGCARIRMQYNYTSGSRAGQRIS